MSKRGSQLEIGSRILGIVLILLLLVPDFVVTDGMYFGYRSASSLEPVEVDEQRAVIWHKNGRQGMLITLS